MPDQATRTKDFSCILTRVDRRGPEEVRKAERARCAEGLWREIKRLQDAEDDIEIHIEAEVIIS